MFWVAMVNNLPELIMWGTSMLMAFIFGRFSTTWAWFNPIAGWVYARITTKEDG